MTRYEKSVGAIIYYLDDTQTPVYLVQQHVNGGHWAFAKGHVEDAETEEETALREIEEETGIVDVTLDMTYRESTVYSPKEGVEKEVVYFIAMIEEDVAKVVIKQDIEVLDIVFLPYEEAFELITYDSDKSILTSAHNYLTK